MNTFRNIIFSMLIFVLLFSAMLLKTELWSVEWAHTLTGIVGTAAGILSLVFSILLPSTFLRRSREVEKMHATAVQNQRTYQEIMSIISTHEAVKLFNAAKKKKEEESKT